MLRTNAKAVSARMSRRATGVRTELERAQRENARATLELAQRLSSGTFKAPKGIHPYSKRNPGPHPAAYIVNVGRGTFRRGWKVRQSRSGQRHSVSVFNDSREAAFFRRGGTRYMIERDIGRAIYRMTLPGVRRRNRQAVRRGLAKR